MNSEAEKRRVGILLFENFELLDVFGPAQMLGMLKSKFELRMVGEAIGKVASSQGPEVFVDTNLEQANDMNIVLIPGGMGTRDEVENDGLISWISSVAPTLEYLVSVCTGSALLAKAGVLDGKRATSNKSAFEWVVAQGPEVEWIKKARWVVDGKYWTSSGVSAGMDMTLALIEEIHGSDLATIASTQLTQNISEDIFAYMRASRDSSLSAIPA